MILVAYFQFWGWTDSDILHYGANFLIRVYMMVVDNIFFFLRGSWISSFTWISSSKIICDACYDFWTHGCKKKKKVSNGFHASLNEMDTFCTFWFTILMHFIISQCKLNSLILNVRFGVLALMIPLPIVIQHYYQIRLIN